MPGHAPVPRAFGALRSSRPLILLGLLTLGQPAAANPIAPSLLACDGEGRLYEIYVIGNYVPGGPAPNHWGVMPSCVLPSAAAYGASDLAKQAQSQSVEVQGRPGSAFLQRANVWTCDLLAPPLADHADLAGLEYRDDVLYAVTAPGGAGASDFCTVDPATGHVSCVFPTGFAGLSGLAWHAPASAFFALGPGGAGEPMDLLRLDPDAGEAAVVGCTGAQHLVSLASSDGFLLAGSGLADGGRLYVLDPVTGAATLIPGDETNEIPEIRGLTTDFGFVVPVRPASWGEVKILYR